MRGGILVIGSNRVCLRIGGCGIVVVDGSIVYHAFKSSAASMMMMAPAHPAMGLYGASSSAAKICRLIPWLVFCNRV